MQLINTRVFLLFDKHVTACYFIKVLGKTDMHTLN